MEYVIKSIEPKSKNVVNKYYDLITGRECDVLWLMKGTSAKLLVDVPYDPGFPHRFYTSPIKDNHIHDDGTLVFETENSVYTLVPNVKIKGEGL